MSATRAIVIACDTPRCRTQAVLVAPGKRAARIELARAGWRSRRDAIVANDPAPAAVVDRCPRCATPSTAPDAVRNGSLASQILGATS